MPSLTIKGVEYETISVAAKCLGVALNTLRYRLDAHWPEDKLADKPHTQADTPRKPGRFKGERDYNYLMDYLDNAEERSDFIYGTKVSDIEPTDIDEYGRA